MTTYTELPPGYGVVGHPTQMYPVIYWLADGELEACRLGDFPKLLGISGELRSEIEADLAKRGFLKDCLQRDVGQEG